MPHLFKLCIHVFAVSGRAQQLCQLCIILGIARSNTCMRTPIAADCPNSTCLHEHASVRHTSQHGACMFVCAPKPIGETERGPRATVCPASLGGGLNLLLWKHQLLGACTQPMVGPSAIMCVLTQSPGAHMPRGSGEIAGMLDSSGVSCLTLSAGMADDYAAAASYLRVHNQQADENGACEQALQLHVHDHVLPNKVCNQCFLLGSVMLRALLLITCRLGRRRAERRAKRAGDYAEVNGCFSTADIEPLHMHKLCSGA